MNVFKTFESERRDHVLHTAVYEYRHFPKGISVPLAEITAEYTRSLFESPIVHTVWNNMVRPLVHYHQHVLLKTWTRVQ